MAGSHPGRGCTHRWRGAIQVLPGTLLARSLRRPTTLLRSALFVGTRFDREVMAMGSFVGGSAGSDIRLGQSVVRRIGRTTRPAVLLPITGRLSRDGRPSWDQHFADSTGTLDIGQVSRPRDHRERCPAKGFGHRGGLLRRRNDVLRADDHETRLAETSSSDQHQVGPPWLVGPRPASPDRSAESNPSHGVPRPVASRGSSHQQVVEHGLGNPSSPELVTGPRTPHDCGPLHRSRTRISCPAAQARKPDDRPPSAIPWRRSPMGPRRRRSRGGRGGRTRPAQRAIASIDGGPSNESAMPGASRSGCPHLVTSPRQCLDLRFPHPGIGAGRRAAERCGHQGITEMPPSTTRLWPVMNEDASGPGRAQLRRSPRPCPSAASGPDSARTFHLIAGAQEIRQVRLDPAGHQRIDAHPGWRPRLPDSGSARSRRPSRRCSATSAGLLAARPLMRR